MVEFPTAHSPRMCPGLSHSPPASTWDVGLPQALGSKLSSSEAPGPQWWENFLGEVRTEGAFSAVAETVPTEDSEGPGSGHPGQGRKAFPPQASGFRGEGP